MFCYTVLPGRMYAKGGFLSDSQKCFYRSFFKLVRVVCCFRSPYRGCCSGSSLERWTGLQTWNWTWRRRLPLCTRRSLQLTTNLYHLLKFFLENPFLSLKNFTVADCRQQSTNFLQLQPEQFFTHRPSKSNFFFNDLLIPTSYIIIYHICVVYF